MAGEARRGEASFGRAAGGEGGWGRRRRAGRRGRGDGAARRGLRALGRSEGRGGRGAWRWVGPVGTWPVVRPCPGGREEELAQVRGPEEGVRVRGEREVLRPGGLRWWGWEAGPHIVSPLSKESGARRGCGRTGGGDMGLTAARRIGGGRARPGATWAAALCFLGTGRESLCLLSSRPLLLALAVEAGTREGAVRGRDPGLGRSGEAQRGATSAAGRRLTQPWSCPSLGAAFEPPPPRPCQPWPAFFRGSCRAWPAGDGGGSVS